MIEDKDVNNDKYEKIDIDTNYIYKIKIDDTLLTNNNYSNNKNSRVY